MKFNYLIFNLVIISGPLIFSFFPYFKRPKFLPTFLSLFLVTLFFFILDIIATDFFWSFNRDYILNIKIFNVPLEEILFFIFTGYSCLFLYLNLKEIKIFHREINLPFLYFSILFFFNKFFFLIFGQILYLFGFFYFFFPNDH